MGLLSPPLFLKNFRGGHVETPILQPTKIVEKKSDLHTHEPSKGDPPLFFMPLFLLRLWHRVPAGVSWRGVLFRETSIRVQGQTRSGSPPAVDTQTRGARARPSVYIYTLWAKKFRVGVLFF